MTVTSADIKERFPEFATVNDGDITVIIAEAARQVSTDAWGPRADDGVKFLTAHLLTNLPPGPPLPRALDPLPRRMRRPDHRHQEPSHPSSPTPHPPPRQ